MISSSIASPLLYSCINFLNPIFKQPKVKDIIRRQIYINTFSLFCFCGVSSHLCTFPSRARIFFPQNRWLKSIHEQKSSPPNKETTTWPRTHNSTGSDYLQNPSGKFLLAIGQFVYEIRQARLEARVFIQRG